MVIPNSVTSIEDYAFNGCRELTSVTIPNSVTWISISAFNGCTGLTDIYYTGTEWQWIGVHHAFSLNSDATIYYNSTDTQISITSISVKTKPDKLTYSEGDALQTSGLTLIATYSDKSTKEIVNDFTCNPTALKTTGTQQIKVTYKGKTATFDVNVTAKNPLIITQLPVNVAVKSGMTASFRVEAVGDGLTYQWQLSDDQGKTWRNSKNTMSSYSTTVTDKNNRRYVRCIVTDKYGNKITSSPAKMEITSLNITEQPSPVTAKMGDLVSFKIKATGDGLTYQWQLSDDQGKTWRNSKATTPSYSTTLSATNSGRYLRCIVTDQYATR